MSEIDEPPAKVLKIDNINGVTHVTEMSSLPEDFGGSVDEEIMGEESGIIEGGADLEQGEGHEEWLSEGILTDDDYNPASQEAEDRTDSQLGTSHDEENPNDSTEHLDTTADSEANIAEIEANEAESEMKVAQSDTNVEGNVGESETNVAKSKENVAQSEGNTMDSETNLPDSDANLIEMEDENVMESQTFTQPYNLESTDSASKANNSKSTANVSKIETNVTITVAIGSQANGQQEKDPKIWNEQNIEETMKHLDGNKDTDAKVDPFDSLLIKKTEVKSDKKSKAESKPESDGNDTDDLLRMLGEDDNSKVKKKLTKTVADIRAGAGNASSDDDDDYIYEGAAKKLKAAKTALGKKQPTKAEPEDMEDGDDENDVSADESSLVKRIFVPRAKPRILAKPAAKKDSTPKAVVKQPLGKNIVNVIEKPTVMNVKQQQNKRPTNARSVLKPTPPKPVHVVKTPYADVKRDTMVKTTTVIKRPEVKTPAPFKPSAVQAVARAVGKTVERPRHEPEEMDGEEFLDDDEFDMNEDELESESDLRRQRQRIMRPEVMDEEVPSDADSRSEDASLYDELPSSESEDMDDWFTLDIRAEKATDYLPLLGTKAKEMLLEEKRRVTARLQTLRKSHTALCESGKKQADQLREATMALAELDDMLKAS